ncbi:MAG: hypothetical protein M3072_14890 [Candidatus Dormibacteraeota bacterium]|nr:hypothetical protein [Candidatus Dormibacteraeota bacterium]
MEAAPRPSLRRTRLLYAPAMGEFSQKKKNKLPDSDFAFPKERKEPLTDPAHVRNASARFNQVKGVSAAERQKAKQRIEKAAKKEGVELSKEPD